MNRTMAAEGTTDTDLVSQTLDGDRDAFGQIVSRYQSLICSLAYSATGNLGQSQDLAQETFITAWKHLRLLRERHKLRAWLCGIARGLIRKALRREWREPTHAAEPLDVAQESEAVEPLPSERAISKEEEAILWRSIERIPEIYREPLVLFYREHQSVEKVAAALDLSEDAVKQRLSRGRKLLHEEVLTFIEGALERSSPGKAFTIGVLAALPAFASSATAASLGVAAAKGAATTKAGAGLVAFNALKATTNRSLRSLRPIQVRPRCGWTFTMKQ
jgi:RNA polymerase sigma factor (sigma-70 family)